MPDIPQWWQKLAQSRLLGLSEHRFVTELRLDVGLAPPEGRGLGIEQERLVVMDVATGELIKHAATAFLAMKVSYVNFLADLCEATGSDVALISSH